MVNRDDQHRQEQATESSPQENLNQGSSGEDHHVEVVEQWPTWVGSVGIMACVVGLVGPTNHSIFICYAHEDNESSDPRLRWLDRLLQFVRPLVRQEDLKIWSDKDIKIGEDWHKPIEAQLNSSIASVLLVSPAFLASDYIANSELPVLLKGAADRGTSIIPILVSPCLYEKVRFKFPDPATGPDELLLSRLQSANPPSRTLVEMLDGEQNRVFLTVALRLSDILVEYETRLEPFPGANSRQNNPIC